MVLRMPGSGAQPIPHVLVDETGLYVKALVQAPPATHLLACSELMTWPEYVKLWSKTLGVPAVFERFTLDDMDKLGPGGFGIEIGEMHAYAMEFGYWGGDPSIVLPADVSLRMNICGVRGACLQYLARTRGSNNFRRGLHQARGLVRVIGQALMNLTLWQ